MLKQKIYVASSWRNYLQAAVVHALRKYGHDVYDFRNPAPGNTGFRWTDAGLETKGEPLSAYVVADFLVALRHPVAEKGFRLDADALEWCETCILLLPCGRSAHLEAGWAKGAGKKLFIVLDDEPVPELMYKFADHIFPGFNSLLDFFAINEHA